MMTRLCDFADLTVARVQIVTRSLKAIVEIPSYRQESLDVIHMRGSEERLDAALK